MVSRVLNFLWLNLECPAAPDPAEGSIRMPMPEAYIENIRAAGARHPEAQVVLWVDSQRLTEKQMDYLQSSVEGRLPNVQLKDLRTIPAYNEEKLYNEAETNPCWRAYCRSLIWRQVDAAKVLISLQGDFDQTFFADLDHAHFNITGSGEQGIIERHGLIIGTNGTDSLMLENQLWGFNRSRRGFFEEYYADVLESAYKGGIGWRALLTKLRTDLVDKGIPKEEFRLLIDSCGPRAEQPGSFWQTGEGRKASPSLIPAGKLSSVFASAGNENSKKVVAQAARLSAAPLRSPR